MKKSDIIFFVVAFAAFFLFKANPFNLSDTATEAFNTIQLSYYKLAVYTGHANDLYNLGSFYCKQEQFDLAENYLLEAANKGSIDASFQLGCIYYEQNKLAVAAKHFKLFADQREDLEVLCNLGLIYAEQKKFDLAKQYYKKPAEQGIDAALANLGFIYDEEGKFDLAEKYYREAADKGMCEACVNLGRLYYRHGRLDQAKKYLNQAVNGGNETAEYLLTELRKLQSEPDLMQRYYEEHNTATS